MNNKYILVVFLWSMWNLIIIQAASYNIAQFFKDRMSSAVCEAGEVCHIDLLSMTMCTCPGQKPCSRDFTKEVRGVEYKFCESMDHMRNCSKGDVYSVHKGIRQILKCLCPFPMEQQPIAYNVVEGWIEYKCDEPKMCDEGDTCRVRKRVPGINGQIDSTLLINQCRCRSGSQCLEISRRQKRHYQPLSAQYRKGKFGSIESDDRRTKLLALEKMFKNRNSDDSKRSRDEFETPLSEKLLRWTFNDRMSLLNDDNIDDQVSKDQTLEVIDEPFQCVTEAADGGNVR